MLKFIFIFLLTSSSALVLAQTKESTKKVPFLWGVATAAYQVEGAYQTDGKGESNWDFLTNKVGVTQFSIGEKQTGNVAINMYDRTQYLKDIALMKELGVNSYRFSLDWSRIIPDGIGALNEVALKHYDVLIDDLLAAGIEPLLTIYHFDYPRVLVEKGGWGNPDMVKWYSNYASIVINRYGKKVKKFITFNEPYIEFFLVDLLLNAHQSKDIEPVQFAKQMKKIHHQFLANALVTKFYHDKKLKGKIGMTLNLEPVLPLDPNNEADKKIVGFQDIMMNKLFLDALLKGTYPRQALDSIQKYDPSFQPTVKEMQLLAAQKPDFLGINYYSPAFATHTQSQLSTKMIMNSPEPKSTSNMGEVRPDMLYKLLIRIKNEYGNPLTIITENGNGFKGEDVKIDNKINDTLRIDYIKRHIEYALKAKKEGVNLQGYMVWSGWDNFEWNSGFTKRFGLIFVDFATQERTPKQSFYEYQKIIKDYK